MNILAIETTGKYGSAAVIDGHGDVAMVRSFGELEHLTEIIELVADSITDAEIGKEDLTHIAASIGPGSFTGIRIGVTVARTIGQALDLPCIAVSSLHGLYVLATESDRFVMANSARDPAYVCTIINARRHQVYGALWRDGEAVLPERQYMIEEILDETAGLFRDHCGEPALIFTGDGVDAYGDIISEWMDDVRGDGIIAGSCDIIDEDHRYQRADAVARVALARSMRTVTYEELVPEYFRKSEAEMRLEEGTLSRKTTYSAVE